MRQGQQNRRGRGRGRKPQNPLARNFESNGPDVKIRGTASHIAEKYMSLARDALASGDTVTAESYLQHAEHYNRIIMAAQQQQVAPQQGGQPSEAPNGGGGRYNRWHSDPDEEISEEESAEAVGQGAQDRQDRPDRERTGGGGQDRERQAGNRERHPGGRERGRGRQGANGSGEGVQDANGSEPAEATASDESENAPDTVS
jgi:hypothetical protein